MSRTSLSVISLSHIKKSNSTPSSSPAVSSTSPAAPAQKIQTKSPGAGVPFIQQLLMKNESLNKGGVKKVVSKPATPAAEEPKATSPSVAVAASSTQQKAPGKQISLKHIKKPGKVLILKPSTKSSTITTKEQEKTGTAVSGGAVTKPKPTLIQRVATAKTEKKSEPNVAVATTDFTLAIDELLREYSSAPISSSSPAGGGDEEDGDGGEDSGEETSSSEAEAKRIRPNTNFFARLVNSTERFNERVTTALPPPPGPLSLPFPLLPPGASFEQVLSTIQSMRRQQGIALLQFIAAEYGIQITVHPEAGVPPPPPRVRQPVAAPAVPSAPAPKRVINLAKPVVVVPKKDAEEWESVDGDEEEEEEEEVSQVDEIFGGDEFEQASHNSRKRKIASAPSTAKTARQRVSLGSTRELEAPASGSRLQGRLSLPSSSVVGGAAPARRRTIAIFKPTIVKAQKSGTAAKNIFSNALKGVTRTVSSGTS